MVIPYPQAKFEEVVDLHAQKRERVAPHINWRKGVMSNTWKERPLRCMLDQGGVTLRAKVRRQLYVTLSIK